MWYFWEYASQSSSYFHFEGFQPEWYNYLDYIPLLRYTILVGNPQSTPFLGTQLQSKNAHGGPWPRFLSWLGTQGAELKVPLSLSISSCVFLPSVALCLHCLFALLIFSPEFSPKSSSTSTITQSQNVTACKLINSHKCKNLTDKIPPRALAGQQRRRQHSKM